MSQQESSKQVKDSAASSSSKQPQDSRVKIDKQMYKKYRGGDSQTDIKNFMQDYYGSKGWLGWAKAYHDAMENISRIAHQKQRETLEEFLSFGAGYIFLQRVSGPAGKMPKYEWAAGQCQVLFAVLDEVARSPSPKDVDPKEIWDCIDEINPSYHDLREKLGKDRFLAFSVWMKKAKDEVKRGVSSKK